MKKGLEKQAGDFVKGGDYEQAQDTCDMLLELEKWREFEGLLVLSENNGMGWTVSKYSEWAQNNNYEI